MSVQITAKMVSDLRAETGAGLMDCKKALVETDGNVEEAMTILRKKGIATAEKKSGRNAGDGLIDYYIHHGGKVGVLLELNCESDFVARNEYFQGLSRDICMHIAAASPVCVSREDVDPELVKKEREIAAAQVEGKPANIIDKIVDGKIDKFLSGICLLEQNFVKNPDVTIQDLLTEGIQKMGENIQVKRFARFQVGE
jgi:elongation factor Ts